MKETDGGKSIKVGVSVPESLARAAEKYAAANANGNLSRVFQDALREHLSANGALPAPEEAEREKRIAELEAAYTPDEIRALIAQRTESSVGNEIVLVP